MSNNFKDNIKNNIKKENQVLTSNSNTNIDTKDTDTKTFKIGKKPDDKNERVQFPFYTEKSKQRELDRVSKKTGYSRNELINMMIDFCLENIEFTE
ncbi:hypothetical protein B0H39_005985 [Clostridium beijerinckii]|uniref:CopG family transcriptional regulator n=1 Tax=Clostridium beijerinckii TaxID=1520 RepID=UPI0014941625|nr:CopG family transcriptional regulator [Clostridium beijerinckii]NOW87954.1 hypothetical protein [Clostridium beijerinckii]